MTIPEDGVITKEQFKTVAGENKKVQFKGTTDDGITYIWTYDCSKIQNPADQNLKIDFSEKDLDDLKKQANNANDALKMTMYGKGLICVPDLRGTASGSVAVQFCISCKRAVWKACKDERCCGNSTGEGRESKRSRIQRQKRKILRTKPQKVQHRQRKIRSQKKERHL